VVSGRVGGTTRTDAGFAPPINQPGTDMSADKDRGIRRQKQKRAKASKKQRRQQPAPVGAQQRPAEKPPAA
jgi:hypothetical protein